MIATEHSYSRLCGNGKHAECAMADNPSFPCNCHCHPLGNARAMRAIYGPESDEYFDALASIPSKDDRYKVDAETTTQQGGIVNDWAYVIDLQGNHNVHANGYLVARALTRPIAEQIAYEHNCAKDTEQRITELEAALRGVARWKLSDGPCWCELKRKSAGSGKIHSRPCNQARHLLAAKEQAND